MGLFDTIRDRSILFAFDRSGFERHQRSFVEADLDVSMHGRTCLVTGANSGLGFELARGLAERGGTVHMLCRSAERGAAARARIIEETGHGDVHLHVVDLSDRSSLHRFARDFSEARVDVLVHNAGTLPLERELTGDGLELTVATHLVGPFLLTTLLKPRLAGARVIFVSSGGMYAKRLDMDVMMSVDGPYDGVAAYAMTKRGQVVLSEQLAVEFAGIGTTFNAMHPGWADTPGVERSLPRFWRFMKKRLRTPEQGADTALWLAVADRVVGETGKLWFDRSAVPTHLTARTREDDEQRRRLWELCSQWAEAAVSSPS